MSATILATKLYVPEHRPSIVARPRLVQRLNDSLHSKLTLISAPAGFGKTTVVSEWLTSYGRPVAWLSLEGADGDPVRFLTYIAAALQTIDAHIGQDAVKALQSPQPAPIESILTALINEIARSQGEIVLVLDDYHTVDSRSVDNAVAFLLKHLPAQMHVIMATREDPALPLAILRARGEMVELRAGELRFTAPEAAEFFNQVMALGLSADDVARLEGRTEGWIAGLQLAALSLQGSQDVPGFIRAFAGDHRYIMDYLLEEVLQRQPESVRSFLLQTAILEQLNGPLCDEVTGTNDGQARVEALQRGNFFVTALDDRRYWYRYHQLFAEVLRARLAAEQPGQVAVLHRRASEWYERNGWAAEAIRHALSAQDFERAAGLIEGAVPAMRQSRQQSVILGWLRALPDEVLRCRPVLSVHYAGALLVTGELKGVEEHLQDAEGWLDTAGSPAAGVAMDEAEFRRLPATIAVYRAAIAQAQGDASSAMKYARQTRELASGDDDLLQGSASGFLGLAYWAMGDLEAAHESYEDCMARVQRAGHVSDAIGCALALADIEIVQGRLREAMKTYERGLQLATQLDTPALRGAADMYVGMSELLRERNELDDATQLLAKSQELGESAGLPQNRYRSLVARARVRAAQDDLDGALDLLGEAEREYAGDFFPNLRPVPAQRARVWIAQGRLADALEWAHARQLSVEDELTYLREFEHITLARLLLARFERDGANESLAQAMELLERLLKAAQKGKRTGSAIEILLLQALGHHAQGDISAALVPFAQALSLAEPEGYVRMFLDAGAPMAELLRAAAAGGIVPAYAARLLAGRQVDASRQKAPASPIPQPLIEPLSQRELEVLRLFKTELSGPEIAQELVISLSTVRSHTKSIFSKLNVNSRRAAVRRAVELNLI